MQRPSKIDALTAVKTLLRWMGEDPDREGLKGTPRRVLQSWKELTVGYSLQPAEVLRTSFSGDDYDQMIILRNIEFASMCEHHLLPFIGVVHVGYLPGVDGRILGISKLARVVEMHARRLQVQERMTRDIATTILKSSPKGVGGVGVIVRAQHLCMRVRGVKKTSEMVTSEMTGAFRAETTRNEFLRLVEGPR